MSILPSDRQTMQDAFEAFISNTNHLRASAEDEEDWASVIAIQSLHLAAELCGDRVLRHAYGPTPDPVDRQASLATASERLKIAFHFFASIEQVGSGSSLFDVANEAASVAGGDYPVLFAPIDRKQGKRRDSYTRAVWQLRALEWEAYFEGLGLKLEPRREMVTSAFGITWSAMQKWRTRDLPPILGGDVIQMKIAIAKREGESDLWFTDRGTDDRLLLRDGAVYKRVLGFNGGPASVDKKAV
ncbi:hypothetical protein [Sphingomonas sp. GM_Shp_1]|uniref:hypothetical protein n=1 Tax=Sphingomonas sp. GM_Shp_1 TaxID=2937381 RepID=UPI00226B9F19|nr:hypothetical protein [Sphingomonas sp. GM_Shp_1]